MVWWDKLQEVELGRLYISRALRMRLDGFCVNNESLFVWKIIILCAVGM